MANVREETHTTNAVPGALSDEPKVAVYDNDRTHATSGPLSSPRADAPIGSTVHSDIAPIESGTNWGGIILGLLVVLALIFLVMWLF